MINSLIKKFSPKMHYVKVRSFTYYIPAPPERKNGYQEKEFDQIFDHLMSLDFDILDFKTQAYAGEKSSGMWIVCILGAKTEKAAKYNLDIEYTDISKTMESHIQLDPSIEHDI